MKNVSIFTFVNAIFVIALSAIIVAFYFFTKWDIERHNFQEKEKYILVADLFLSGFEFFPTNKELKKLYDKFNVYHVKDRQEKLRIINNAKLLFLRETHLGRVRVFEQDNIRYIYIQKFGYNLMLKDLNSKAYSFEIALFMFSLIVLVLVLAYFAFINKLLPLKKLHQQINKFAEGDLSVHVQKEGDDEIGKIADSFNKAIMYINKLLESKNLFMRNMMHELKTPITKGRILAQMIENGENKELLIKSFDRMNEIITKLAQIDKLNFDILLLNKEKYRFSQIVEKTKELLIDENRSIIIEIEKDFYVMVDSELFTVALKNLLDNGIKFSLDKRVYLKAKKCEVTISSKGEKLTHPLEYYTEAFSQEQKRYDGFGLGLYITKTILDAHGFELKYQYENGYNQFIIQMPKNTKTSR